MHLLSRNKFPVKGIVADLEVLVPVVLVTDGLSASLRTTMKGLIDGKLPSNPRKADFLELVAEAFDGLSISNGGIFASGSSPQASPPTALLATPTMSSPPLSRR